MNNLTTIEEVLLALDEIISISLDRSDPAGVFAALYRSVTANVRSGIVSGRFEEGARMERFDVVFALRYIDAWRAYRNNKSTTSAWKLAFDATQRADLFYLQHLLLGMNAHINLDLAIAAAATCPGDEIAALENDFMEINLLLAEMTDQVQERLARVSPLLGWIDRMALREDEKLAGFSLTLARDYAWGKANLLAPLPQDQWPPIIGGDGPAYDAGWQDDHPAQRPMVAAVVPGCQLAGTERDPAGHPKFDGGLRRARKTSRQADF